MWESFEMFLSLCRELLHLISNKNEATGENGHPKHIARNVEVLLLFSKMQ